MVRRFLHLAQDHRGSPAAQGAAHDFDLTVAEGAAVTLRHKLFFRGDLDLLPTHESLDRRRCFADW
jgi:hypothetical protein